MVQLPVYIHIKKNEIVTMVTSSTKHSSLKVTELHLGVQLFLLWHIYYVYENILRLEW